MKSHRRLKITDNLLMLQRGKDELLLADGLDLRPLYVKKGRKYIAHFLKAASDLGSCERITGAFPHETDLLDRLKDHGIIVPCAGPEVDKRPERLPGALGMDNPRSVSLFLLISQSCNMGCVYCLNGARTYQTDQNLRMGQEVAFKSVERCRRQCQGQL